MDLIKKDNVRDILHLRNDYHDRLCQPQELYSELMMKDSIPHVITKDGKEIGYALVGDEKVLLEFHILEEHLPFAIDAFKFVLDRFPLETAACQSFDHLFLSMCILHLKKRKVVGFNFRDIRDLPKLKRDPDLSERVATLEDVELLTRYRDGIFDDDEVKEIPYWVGKGSSIIFEDAKGGFIGYGMFNRTVGDRTWHDVGMYVNPDLRKMGYGVYIIRRMMEKVVELGGVPTAGCTLENTGSKRTLEKAGFSSRHILVEFER